MGHGHSTHVSNGYGKDIVVVGTHSDGRIMQALLKHGEVKTVTTDPGMVYIHIYHPEHFNIMNHVERKGIPSNVGVTITKNFDFKPKIVRVSFGSFWEPDPYNN
ncbi:hypothetical protein FKM82_027130 [Ascaphus truei]